METVDPDINPDTGKKWTHEEEEAKLRNLKEDDLKYILLKFGKNFRPAFLKVVQDEYHRVMRSNDRFYKKY